MTPARAVADRPAPQALDGVARGGALNLSGAGYAALAGFGVATLVARGLSRTEAGVFFTATTLFVVIAVVAKLGTPTGLVYWFARLRTRGRSGLLRRCLQVALRPVVLVSAGLGAAGWIGAGWLTGDLADEVRILAVLLPLAAVSDALLAATRGFRTMRPTVAIDRFGRPTLQLLGVAGALLLGASVSWFTVAWVAPWALAAVAAWFALRPLLPHQPSHPATVATAVTDPRLPRMPAHGWPGGVLKSPAWRAGPARPANGALRHGLSLDRAFWRFTWPRGASNVLQQLLQRLDVLLVAGLLGFAAAAGYAVATRFTVVGQLGNAAIATAVEPRLAEALAREDDVAARRLYQTATAWLVLATWPIYLLTAVFAPLYLTLFGPAYATGEAVTVVVLLCAAMLISNGCGMVDVVLAMTGRTTWNLGNVSAALLINVGLNLVLLPRLGILGAGIAWAASMLAKNLLPLGQLAIRRGLHPYGRATVTAAALTAGCFGVLPLVAVWSLGVNLPALLSATAVGVTAYLTGLWRLREPLQLSPFAALRRRSIAEVL
ncbi:MAG: lipopolysaccharide biosynthesis protein [Micromonosporaceae bacterium]